MTKAMTAYMVFDAMAQRGLTPDQRATISAQAAGQPSTRPRSPRPATS
jgi:D-alanyl-D-alanine carboxypeptidase